MAHAAPPFLVLIPPDPLRKMLLTQGSAFEDVPEGVTVVSMILIQYEDHSEVWYLFDGHGLQAMKVWISTPELLVHGCQVMEVQTPLPALHVHGYYI